MFRSLVIGLGSMCAIALAVLAFQNSSDLRIGERLSSISLPKIALFDWSGSEDDAAPVDEPWQIADKIYAAELRKLASQLREQQSVINNLTAQRAQDRATISAIQSGLASLTEDTVAALEAIPAGTDPAFVARVSDIEARLSSLSKDLQARPNTAGVSMSLFRALRDDVRKLDSELSEIEKTPGATRDIERLRNEVGELNDAVTGIASDLAALEIHKQEAGGVSLALFRALREEVRKLEAAIQVVEFAQNEMPKPDYTTLGMTLRSQGPGKRILIVSVSQESEAWEKGIRQNDEIDEAGQKAVYSFQDFNRQVSEARSAGRGKILLLVRRDEHPRFVALSIREN